MNARTPFLEVPMSLHYKLHIRNLHWTTEQQQFWRKYFNICSCICPRNLQGNEINFPSSQICSSLVALTKFEECYSQPPSLVRQLPLLNSLCGCMFTTDGNFLQQPSVCETFQIPLNLIGKEFGANIILIFSCLWSWIRLLFWHEKGHSLVLHILVAFFLNEYLILLLHIFAVVELINFFFFPLQHCCSTGL